MTESAQVDAWTVDKWARRAFGFGLALLVFAIDRGVKALLMGPVRINFIDSIPIVPFFSLRFAENHGVSYGLLTADSEEMRWVLIGVTSLIAAGVAGWIMVERRRIDVIGLAFVLGGALGNIYDRLYHGYVIDYAAFHLGTWYPFGIFNLADVAITLGVLILLARSLLSGEKPANTRPNGTGPKSPTENP